MPRKTQDKNVDETNLASTSDEKSIKVKKEATKTKKEPKTASKSKTTSSSKAVASKTSTSKASASNEISTHKKTTTTKKQPSSKAEKSANSKTEKLADSKVAKTTSSKEEKNFTSSKIAKTTGSKVEKSASSNVTTKKAKATVKKEVTEKKSTKSTTKKRKASVSSTKSSSKIEVLEYYDLPYRYNETVVKILAQTPTTLFVYWDISDSDRQNLINQYGEKLFEETKPILIIRNESNNYSFEVDINDFANSWYLKIPDSKSVYSIELGRKPINNYKNIKTIPQNYLFIASSNKLEVPNNKILFDTLKEVVYFKNVKNNSRKTVQTFSFMKDIGKIYNIYDIYQKIYPAEDIQDFILKNPSSGFTSF